MLVSELIDRTLNQWLYPAGVSRPSYDTLASSIDSSQTSIATEGRITIPRDSILEIESELILTHHVDGVTVTANERGYLETAGASHAAGKRIWLDPDYPRQTLFNVLCDVIGNLYPWVYQRVVDTSKTYTTKGAMALPTGTLELLRVTVQDMYTSYTDYITLKPEKHFDVMYDFSPPKIRFWKGGTEGDPLFLTVAKDFTLPTDETDDLTTDCGVTTALAPHLAIAVAGQVLQGKELPRVTVDQIRRLLAQQGIQIGSALNVGQALKSMFEQKVAVERRRLRALDPPALVIER